MHKLISSQKSIWLEESSNKGLCRFASEALIFFGLFLTTLTAPLSFWLKLMCMENVFFCVVCQSFVVAEAVHTGAWCKVDGYDWFSSSVNIMLNMPKLLGLSTKWITYRISWIIIQWFRLSCIVLACWLYVDDIGELGRWIFQRSFIASSESGGASMKL